LANGRKSKKNSIKTTAVLATSYIIRKVLQFETSALSCGDSCWLKRRGSGERRCVTGNNMMMIIIIVRVIIMSPKTDIISLYVKK
jgi:hypothetical protein